MSDSTRQHRYYLDHAATTPLRPEVVDAMRPFFTERFGNPSSLHEEGRTAREALEAARESIRQALCAGDFDLFFTGGGTEADNTAILGPLLAAGAGRRVVTSRIEHAAILHTAPLVERLGSELVTVGVDRDGRVDAGEVLDRLTGSTVLVSIMAANNETGTLQPLEAIGEEARRRGVAVHTDAVQCLGKLCLPLDRLPVDLVTLSAHKVYGPKGVGALLVRRGTDFAPWIRGGSQERGYRGGTESVAAAVGFARALELVEAERDAEMERLEAVRDRLRELIVERFPGVVHNTPRSGTLPTLLNVSFPHVEGESLVKLLDHLGVGVSTGSACNVGASKPSHVLAAMGRADREVRGSLRFSLGRSNRLQEMSAVADRLHEAVSRLASIAPT